MRPIKFRGIEIKSKRWVYGAYVPAIDEDCCDSIIDEQGALHIVFSETVGQYTGLKDKNGKEIWEGDVIKDTGGCAPKIGAVIYENGEFRGLYNFPKQDNVCGFCEIIGNIYGNPELLK